MLPFSAHHGRPIRCLPEHDPNMLSQQYSTCSRRHRFRRSARMKLKVLRAITPPFHIRSLTVHSLHRGQLWPALQAGTTTATHVSAPSFPGQPPAGRSKASSRLPLLFLRELTGRKFLSSTPNTRWYAERHLFKYYGLSLEALRLLFGIRGVTHPRSEPR